MLKKNKLEEFECSICNKLKIKTPEQKLGRLRSKKDFEKLFDTSSDPWNHKRLTKWELKSIKEINSIIDINIPKRGMNILDIGVATGEKDYRILKRFDSSNKFYFVDISSKAICKAKKIIPLGKFIQKDINQGLDFKDNYFNLVLCLELIYYLNLKNVIKEFKRLIKPEGYILFDITLKDEYYKYGPKELFKLLKNNKFELKKSKYLLCPKCKRKRGFFLFKKVS